MQQDRVTLTVPSRSEYAKTVRMTAAALVSRMGMSYDDVDDVRMAAEEAFVYAADTFTDGSDIRFDFTLDDDSIQIEVGLGSEAGLSDDEVERRTSYATFILESVCDSFDLLTDEEGGSRLRLFKRAGSLDDA